MSIDDEFLDFDRCLAEIAQVLLAFTELIRFFPSSNGFDRVLLGFTGFYLVLLGFTGYCWVSLVVNGF